MDTFRSFTNEFDALRDTIIASLQALHDDGQLEFNHYGGFLNILGGIRYCFNCVKWAILDFLVRSSATSFPAEDAVLAFLNPRLTELGFFAQQTAVHATGSSILNVIMLTCQRWSTDCIRIISDSLQ